MVFLVFFFFSSRRRHTRYIGDWSSDVCSSDLSLRPHVQGEVGVVIAMTSTVGSRRAGHMVERNYTSYRRNWMIFLTGFAEPLFYLFSVRIGISHLVGGVTVGGNTVGYRQFVAPAL